MRTKINLRRAVAATLLFLPCTSLQAQPFSPVAPARGFNVFTSDSVILVAGDTHGPIATGGNLKLKGKTDVAINNSGTYPYGAGNANNFGLVVNGRVQYTNGNVSYVNQGYIRLGDATGSALFDKDGNGANTNLQITSGLFNTEPRVQLQKMQDKTVALEVHGINFGTAFDSLKRISHYISTYNLSDPVTAQDVVALTIPAGMNPHITLTPGKVNYITLTGTELNNLTSRGSIIFDNKPNATTPIVFNITAPGSFSWDPFNAGSLDESDGAFILWNFYGNSSLQLAGGNSIYGTILAPESDVNKSGANNNNGQIIAKSLRMAYGEVHYMRFSSLLPSPTPLPLSGLQLAVQSNTGYNLLQWQTLNERDMVSFSIERSTDGKTFRNLNTVNSLGNGDHTYSWQDPAAPEGSGQLFYRVKGIDRGGKISYSNVAALRQSNLSEQVRLYPNPFTSYINLIPGTPADYTYRLTDISGRTVKAGKVGAGQITNLEALPTATYWLMLEDANNQPVLFCPVIKQ